ncbi:MAG: dihydroorotate dehydrogenase electron transfer subunit [Anaerolineae bacterium]|nr:dihydroorotate dehydrogenase electron transfer subunit [Anaerolineae bacterium]
MADGLHRVFPLMRRVEEGKVGATLIFDGELKAQPGQFVMVWLPGVGERPFSVVDDAPLTLTVARVGPFTRALTALQEGERVWIRGPFGRPFPLRQGSAILVAGGSGVASLAFLAKRLCEKRTEPLVILGARTEANFMLTWFFERMGLCPLLATDDGSKGWQGTAVERLEALSQPWRELIYGCGPERMLRALASSAVRHGALCWLSLERVMKCGIGVCGHCHCGDQLVCRDGPVFSAEEALRLWRLEARDNPQIADREDSERYP